MDLFDIATSLGLKDVNVKTYFKDSSKNRKFTIYANKVGLVCGEPYRCFVNQDISHFKYNVKRKILSLYYED